MRLVAFTVLVWAATAASQSHEVLQSPIQSSSTLTETQQNLKNSFNSLSKEARAAWDEVAMMFPELMKQLSSASYPKEHSRRSDSQWDYIVKGAEIPSVWVKNEAGEKGRDTDENLAAYDLRAKTVDPGVLGIDPGVKQYSGYLDDNENDKHLFYCMPRFL